MTMPAGKLPVPRTPAVAPEPGRIPGRRWRIALLLGLGVLVNYFDRVNLSVSHHALIAAFAISDVTFGYLSAAYNWSYALCQLPIGVLLDRFGVRKIGRIGTFLWSVASFATAGSPWMSGLFASRLLLGIGEAPTFPANAKAVGYWFPPEERSMATAIFDSTAKLASAIGVPLIGILMVKFGWRWGFAATGVVSFLYFLIFWAVYKDPDEDPGLSPQELAFIRAEYSRPAAEGASSGETATFGHLLRQRKVYGVLLGFGAYNYVFYLLLTWLPSYLSSALHIDIVRSLLYTSAPWLIATAADLAVGGYLVDKLIAIGWPANTVRRVVLVTGTGLGLGIFGAAHASTAGQALAWISLSIGGLSAAAPVVWSLPSLLAPRQSVGALGGIMNFSSQLSGISAPIVTGYLVAYRHSYAWAFGVAAAYLVIGVAGYVFLLGKIERIPANGPDGFG